MTVLPRIKRDNRLTWQGVGGYLVFFAKTSDNGKYKSGNLQSILPCNVNHGITSPHFEIEGEKDRPSTREGEPPPLWLPLGGRSTAIMIAQKGSFVNRDRSLNERILYFID